MSTFVISTLSRPRNSSISRYFVADGHANQPAVCPRPESITAQRLSGMDWIRSCAGIATHSCWSAWNNSRSFAGAFILPQTRQMSLHLGEWKARGDFGHCCWQGTVWWSVLDGVRYCRAEIRCRTTFDDRNIQQKQNNFEQYTLFDTYFAAPLTPIPTPTLNPHPHLTHHYVVLCTALTSFRNWCCKKQSLL